jgi:hypothetical protein
MASRMTAHTALGTVRKLVPVSGRHTHGRADVQVSGIGVGSDGAGDGDGEGVEELGGVLLEAGALGEEEEEEEEEEVAASMAMASRLKNHIAGVGLPVCSTSTHSI